MKIVEYLNSDSRKPNHRNLQSIKPIFTSRMVKIVQGEGKIQLFGQLMTLDVEGM